METVAQLGKDFAGIQEMRSAEGKAIVEQNAAVGDVEGAQGDGKPFAKLFAESEVKGGVPREMIGRRIAVRES